MSVSSLGHLLLDDDSASIDDENIENSQTIGLAAVLEILGGRVIEEKMPRLSVCSTTRRTWCSRERESTS